MPESNSPVPPPPPPPPTDAERRCDIIAEVTGGVVYERPLDAPHALVSPSMATVFGYAPELAFTGGLEWWLDRVHEDDRVIVSDRMSGHRPGHNVQWSVEYRVQRHDGTWAIVQDQGRTIDAENGLPARVIGIITDISHVKALQGQLQHSQRLELVGRLAAGVAHDFNNVLSAISGFTSEILHSLDGEDPRAEDLREIETLVERAAGLTGHLLGLTRHRDHGRTRLVNVAEQLRRLAPTLRILVGSAIDLEIATDEFTVSTAIDPGLLDQVVLNLAANARDATADGGRVHVHAGVVGPESGPRVRVTVRDNGSGIPPQVLERVFQPFFTTKAEHRGTGLGLWLVREIIEAANGTIAVQSSPLEGTVVTFELPAVDEPPSADPRTRRQDERVSTGHTVLLIEDEESLRYITRRVLERRGYRVLDAGAGIPGLDLLEANRDTIDVIVTDLHMPGLAGEALVRRLRETAPEISCLIVSGLAERFRACPPIDGSLVILAKPCEFAELVRHVAHLAVATGRRRAACGAMAATVTI
jgi:PAS domain S-box-containing protein